MNINEIINLIENFAPPETQESWDCSGWAIDEGAKDVRKILLCLSVTENIIKQAIEQNCELIVSHHPMFFVPFDFKKGISIYCAHTNLDKTNGGTTDTLIDLLNLNANKIEISEKPDFLRFIELRDEVFIGDFVEILKNKLNIEHIKVVNNLNVKMVKKIALCAGSGADFWADAKKNLADILITGDVKYHNALDSSIVIVDVGHFESERPILKTIKNLLGSLNIEVIIADEKNPFIFY